MANLVRLMIGFLKLVISRSLRLNVMGTTLDAIYNGLQLSDRIGTAGQPTPEQFAAIKAAGYGTVINLALTTSLNAIADEGAIVESLGMHYAHIPVQWEAPTLEDFTHFSEVMQAHADQPIFVHCAANMRVSAFMYLYRRIHERVNEHDARQDLAKIWTPNPTWEQFIRATLARYGLE